MRSVIILFAKAPIPGRVKTRLIPALTAQEAADLHIAFAGDLIERLLASGTTDLELHTDIPSDAWQEFVVARKLQIPGDLGLKMFHSLQGALSGGYERAMIVGTDAPTLPLAYLRDLLTSSADVALGPTDDGGYYAISAKRTHPAMFRGVRWSTSYALSDTIKALEDCGLSVEIGPNWFDVDEPADLARLTGEIPHRTSAFLQQWRARMHPTS